jgi:hypothetical protein
METLEARIRRTEDIQAITRLKSLYCNTVDRGFPRDKRPGETIEDIFVEDGLWDAGQQRSGIGWAGIRAALKSPEELPLGIHLVLNPLIEVDGDTATGQWHLLMMMTLPDGQPWWATAIYNDEFVRTSKGWRFKAIRITPILAAPHAKGWGGPGPLSQISFPSPAPT